MTTNTEIAQVAELLKPASQEVFNGKGKLCLSTTYLHKLNYVLDDNLSTEDVNNSFHILPATNLKNNVIRDTQFLLELVQRTKCLKILPDVVNECTTVDISKFCNVEALEIHKLNINSVFGIQKLRVKLQQVNCSHSMKDISDFLEKCGGDESHPYVWNELKNVIFCHNRIEELGDSFEYTPWLQSLNLSHNELTNVEELNRLTNLKHLNLSYNKLESVPLFKGQLCNRLQVLIIKNNFIEDISGLSSLVNLVQLDLSQNCLLDHKSLISISHAASLQVLNLLGNPLSFHPSHRQLTCKYLNKNISTLKFVLSNVALDKNEKQLTGTFHPMVQAPTQQPTSLTSSTNSLLDFNSPSISSEKPRRIRNVTIEDYSTGTTEQPVVVASSLTTSYQHLEIKKQVEQLRGEFGESWLNSSSGLLVQDVLGIEKSPDSDKPLLSSTPYGSLTTPFESAVDSTILNQSEEVKSDNVKFETASDEPTVFDTAISNEDDNDISDGEDLGGEECIYFATVQGETDQIFVVVTQSHISEKEGTTSKERARWHISTIINCEILPNNPEIVRLEFDTVRRDRKQRLYVLDVDDVENFSDKIKENMDKIVRKETKSKTYLCMKCSLVFSKNNNNRKVLESLECPKCESNLVVENDDNV